MKEVEGLQDVLQKQVILEFKEKGLQELIAFFMAQYPDYPYIQLPIQKLKVEYLSNYDISFLASYIRYSDIELLESGMRDLEVREKIIFLHSHIGTISHAYRKFIWSDKIQLEDIKRWLPLLGNYSLKERILKSSKITDSFKSFLDACLDSKSYAYQNLIMLNELYPNMEFVLADFLVYPDQEILYKLLQLVQKSGEVILWQELLKGFHKLYGLLKIISIDKIDDYAFIIPEYFRGVSYYAPIIGNMEEFKLFQEKKKILNKRFLEREYDVFELKQFYSRLFLGMSYQEFEYYFQSMINDGSFTYQLLKKFYNVRFPLSLKENLYEEFMKQKNLKSYIDKIKSSSLDIKHQCSLFYNDPETEISTLHDSNFMFLTIPLSEYQDYVSKKEEELVRGTVQSNMAFYYDGKSCLLDFSDCHVVSYDGMNSCFFANHDLVPNRIIAFDTVTFVHLNLQKQLHLPITVIDTESYVKRNVLELDELFEIGDWKSYFTRKKALFESVKEHDWLRVKYFSRSKLYGDVYRWMGRLDGYIHEKLSKEYLRCQLEVFRRLILFHRDLEEKLQIVDGERKENVFFYQKNLKMYDQLRKMIEL